MKIGPTPPLQTLHDNATHEIKVKALAPEKTNENPFDHPAFKKAFFDSLAMSVIATGSFAMNAVRRNQQTPE